MIAVAGLVASVLVPVILAIQSRTGRADEPASASNATAADRREK